MAENTISLELKGTVPLELYYQAVANFTALIMALTNEIVGDSVIQWTVTELHAGSAYHAITGFAEQPQDVEKVVNAYRIVGRALASQQMIPYSQDVEKAAVGITSVLNGKINLVRFGTGSDDDPASEIYKPVKLDEQIQLDKRDLGVIEGVVRSITDRPSLKIGVYDDIADKRIDCFLSPNQAEEARSIWLKRIAVTGMIKRDPDTGKAIDVRNIIKIQSLSKTVGGFLSARGALGHDHNEEPPEIMIRRLRDGI